MAFHLEEIPLVDSVAEAIDLQRYVSLPGDWSVFITDVRGSTKAIESGRYKDINVIGTSCILAAINAVKPAEVLFAFGGDGATILCPSTLSSVVGKALLGVKRLSQKSFGFELRVACVPLTALHQAGATIKVLRYRMGKARPLVQLGGTGVGLAETWAKDPVRGREFEVTPGPESDAPDLDGLECRWEPIQSRRGKTITLLALSLEKGAAEAARFYQDVLALVAGPEHDPVSTERLNLAVSPRAFRAEALSRRGGGWRAWIYGAKAYFITQFARLFWKSVGRAHGENYFQELVAQSDHCKFDGMLRLVGEFSDTEITRLEQMLNGHFQKGKAVYGINISSSALLTCMIFNRKGGDHLHFIDGSDGGYALAAKAFKRRLKELVPA